MKALSRRVLAQGHTATLWQSQDSPQVSLNLDPVFRIALHCSLLHTQEMSVQQRGLEGKHSQITYNLLPKPGAGKLQWSL